MRLALLVSSVAAMFSTSAIAEPPTFPGVGKWVTPSSSCPMALEVKPTGQVIRSTGSLSYTTIAGFIPHGIGWQLKETLQSNNDGVSCNGENASEVAKHLEQAAYVEVIGATLYYYPVKGARRLLKFERRAAQQSIQADELKPAA